MMSESLSIWILDPANLTPFYSLALAQSLVGKGDRVRFVTSRFTYDPDLEIPADVGLISTTFGRGDVGSLGRKCAESVSRDSLSHRSSALSSEFSRPKRIVPISSTFSGVDCLFSTDGSWPD